MKVKSETFFNCWFFFSSTSNIIELALFCFPSLTTFGRFNPKSEPERFAAQYSFAIPTELPLRYFISSFTYSEYLHPEFCGKDLIISSLSSSL